MPLAVDLSGMRFSRLTALSPRPGSRQSRRGWLCRCVCGNEVVVPTDKLLAGHTRSCGCLQRESVADTNTRHGQTGVPEYQTWKGIKARCGNPNHPAYENYGGRGVTMCPAWETDFSAFLRDMGPKPDAGHTVERLDNSVGYEPGNCVWATRGEQSRNKRNNRWLTYQGETLILRDWADRLGITPGALGCRLDKFGWPVAKALSVPARRRKPPDL